MADDKYYRITKDEAFDPSVRLNNNVQYVMNILKTYGYTQPVLDSFKQNIDKILANTKDNNKIDTANKYIDQFLGDKQDLRRRDQYLVNQHLINNHKRQGRIINLVKNPGCLMMR